MNPWLFDSDVDYYAQFDKVADDERDDDDDHLDNAADFIMTEPELRGQL